MTRRWLGLCLWLVVCAAAAAAPAGGTWVSPALAGQTLDAALSSRFEVRLKDGRAAGLESCAELVRLDAQIVEESSGNNIDAKAFQSARVQCQALAALKTLQRARRSRLPAAPETNGLAAALESAAPALMYLSISDDSEREVQQAHKRGLSLKQFRPGAVFRQTRPDSARIEVDDTLQDVQLLARGDFNADGVEDWLLRVDSRVIQGSYGSSSLWLVTRLQANRPWRVLKRWP